MKFGFCVMSDIDEVGFFSHADQREIGRAATVLHGVVVRILKPELLKHQRIGDEVLHLGVNIGSGLVAQLADRIGVMVEFETGPDQ